MDQKRKKHATSSVAFEPPTPALPDYLALHARWHVQKPALITNKAALSWQEFDRATNRIANGLHSLGLGPGDMVGVVMTNSEAMAIVLFGIMKAGCCSVPINLSITDDAIGAMLEDSGAKALFVSDDQMPRIEAMKTACKHALPETVICAGNAPPTVISLADWEAKQSEAAPTVTIPPSAPCNVIYSSGTTGLPKGIVHTFQGRLDWAYDMCVSYGYHPQARTLCTIGLYSNIMWAVMLATLLAGGTLIIHQGFDAETVLSNIHKHAISHTAMVPIQWQRLVDAGASADGLSTIQSAITVGSAMHRDLKTKMLDLMPDAFIELYGLTEGILTAQSPADMRETPDSVGKPILGCDLKILDNDDRECPTGKAGEIVSRARYVMPGYLNRPDATADCQWADENGHIWLRTGDIGYLDEHGFLYIVDRKKDMILSGGQNIYPADIETVLIRHDSVSDCAVIGVPDDKWGETPLAVVIAAKKADAASIKDWLNARLGKQQRVKDVVFCKDIPRNPNGKILKRILRDHYAKGLL